MFGKLFKEKIPVANAQEVEVLQSWTLEWKIQGDSFMVYKTFHKAFTNLEHAKTYEKELKEAASFLGTWVKTSIIEN